MKKIFLTVVLFLSVALSFSQSLLWKVTGKDLQGTSYLYGTIHIQDQRVFNFDTTVMTALYSCDAFAGELLLDEINPQDVKDCTYLPKGKTISGMMSEANFKKLDSLCKETVGVTAYLFNGMKPFFVMSAFQQSAFSQDQEDALDLFFLRKAREANKFCYGLETFKIQMSAIDAISLKDQMKMLVNALENQGDTTSIEATALDPSAEMLTTYLAFDLDKMIVMCEDPSMPKKFNKIFLIDRNAGMAKEFVRIAKSHSLFCGVGAAHLGGEKGLINLLRKKGYTVEPVIFNWKKEAGED